MQFLSGINATKQCHHFNQSLVDMFINISFKGCRLFKLLKPTDYKHDCSAGSNQSLLEISVSSQIRVIVLVFKNVTSSS